MGASHGDTDAGSADLHIAVHDLARLVVHLQFLLRVVIVAEDVDLGDEVVGELVGELLHLGLFASCDGLDLVIQLGHTTCPSSAGGLIGGYVDTADVAEALDGVQGDDHLDGCAVGVGDDATGADEGIGSIYLRYDERDIILHTEGAGVVDHHGAVLGDRLCILEGYTPTGRDEGHVNILEVIAVLEQAYRIFLPKEGDLLPRATLGGEQF